VLIGFAAETHDVLDHAAAKRARKGVDLIVANDVAQPGAGFEVETNVVTFLDAQGRETLPLMTKMDVAVRLIDRLERLLGVTPAAACA
jgi:phosphopantothenoylcysteine decarboxylase/phosphopantothenate--cysteine ligase